MTDKKIFDAVKFSVPILAWDDYCRAARRLNPGVPLPDYTAARFEWCMGHPVWLEEIFLFKVGGNW